ncbi:MAG: hypothetical protein ABIE23_02185 [archaeon]
MKKRKQYFNYLLVLVGVFAVFLAYIMFFNAGLSVYGEEGKLFVENSSKSIIRNVSVFVMDGGEKKLIASIDELSPGERREVMFEGKKARFIVEAGFHPSIEKEVVFA